MDVERGVGVADAFYRIRVLLVDDDPGIVGMLRLKLETSGYLVQEAYRGGEALSLISRHRPDLVLLDISMPDMGGMEVLTRIRQQNLDIAVIMMTAFGSQEVAVEALRNSADDYMIKPFDMQELMFVVERTVNRLQKNRASAAARRQVEAEIAQAATIQADLMPPEHTGPPRIRAGSPLHSSARGQRRLLRLARTLAGRSMSHRWRRHGQGHVVGPAHERCQSRSAHTVKPVSPGSRHEPGQTRPGR